MQAQLELLGGPRLLLDGIKQDLSINRSLLLASYLAFQADWVSRDEILTVFWPQATEVKARQSLRALIYQCKKMPYAFAFAFEDQQMRWLGQTDISAFQEAISKGQWQKAVELYSGAFLEKVQSDDSSAFNSWLEQTRDELLSAWRNGALLVAKEDIALARYNPAINLLEAVLYSDFLAEDVVQLSMRAYALAGQKEKALKTFEVFRKSLLKELELEPVEATLELAEKIRTGLLEPSVKLADIPGPTQERLSQASFLPQALTPFVGRTLELLELSQLLKQENTRLITLLGPGGIGKSRLSLQLLREQKSNFLDGVYFVSLAPLRSDHEVPDAVASALQLRLSGEARVAEEVFSYLANKSMLIVLDNTEHLSGIALFVKRLLEQAPKCIFICTSRLLLGLPNELVYDVVGLSVPSVHEESSLDAYDAVQLFIRTARRVRSDFSLQKADYPLVIELCQFLEGMPLALELAASWVRLFSLPDLYNELRKDIDLLEATAQEVSERHTSLRKVFETSWTLLNSEQQRVLAVISVFRGGFDLQAVHKITGASPRILLSLVNTSLLRTTSSGRFSILEVIRQYAAEKLVQDQELLDGHAEHYLGVLASLTDNLKGDSPKSSLTIIENDLENIRTAWHWALERLRFDLCYDASESLFVFLKEKARYQEALTLLKEARKVLANHPNAKLQMLLAYKQGACYYDINDYSLARALCLESLALAKTLNDSVISLRNILVLANICNALGDYDQAFYYAEEALALAQQLGSEDLIVRSRDLLAMIEEFRGNFATSEEHYRFVLNFHRESRQKLELVRALNNYGCFLNDTARPGEAKPLFLEGLELVENAGLNAYKAFFREGVGNSAYLLGDFAEAIRNTEQALILYIEHGDSEGQAVTQTILANSYLAQKEFKKATIYAKQAVHLCKAKDSRRKLMTTLLAWAEISLAQDDLTTATTLLTIVKNHGASKKVCKEAAETVAKRYSLQLLPKISDDELDTLLTAFLNKQNSLNLS